MTQLATTPQSGQIVQADAESIMAIISRAATDPAVDVDKLERLVGLYERIGDRGAEVAFNDAMNVVQSKTKKVMARKKNSQTNSFYATYQALDEMIRPVYTGEGFSLSFNTAPAVEANTIRVTCRVSHRAGHSAEYQVDMPADGKGAKGADVMTKTHAAGAAMTYGQRYLLKLIFNIAIGTDNDGNGATAKPDNSSKVSAAPEGADFWDCIGPGMSSHAAKAEGMGDLHNAMLEGIAEQHTGPAMNEWINNNLAAIQRMPKSWRIILRQAVDEQADAWAVKP